MTFEEWYDAYDEDDLPTTVRQLAAEAWQQAAQEAGDRIVAMGRRNAELLAALEMCETAIGAALFKGVGDLLPAETSGLLVKAHKAAVAAIAKAKDE